MQNFLGPKSRMVIRLVGVFFVLELLARIIFYFVFSQSAQSFSFSQVLHAFYLGIKFDLRIALVLSLPLALFIVLINPQKSPFIKKFWIFLYTTIFGGFVVFYMADFYYYDYLNSRINGTILKFAQNPLISAQMVWQSYPVAPLVLTVLLLCWLVYNLNRKLIFVDSIKSPVPIKRQGIVSFAVVALIFLLGLHGKFSQYPLRWSEAFFSNNGFVSAMALNPIHYFADTYRSNRSKFDRKKVAQHYEQIATYLGVDKLNPEILSFKRMVPATPMFKNKPNVVVIVMESMAFFKTNLGGHPQNPTPEIERLANSGLLFNEYYVPSEGTARSMFCLVTGVPDVTSYKTSSRNPLIVNQNTFINAFSEYEKYYFIGGSANWGEIRGIFSANVPDINIIEEGMYHSPRTDVWGISDYHLFKESVEKLSQRKSNKPFFAVVQTAGFHRPYTIPEDRGNFETRTINEDEIKKMGLYSLDEFNALRFSDFSLKTFFDEIKKQPFFENTLFVITGDHGLPSFNAQHIKPGHLAHGLARFHVPLIFYAPKLIREPKVIDSIATEPDVLPTISAITGHSFPNTALGRNLFSSNPPKDPVAFTFVYHTNPQQYSIMTKEFLASGNTEHGIQNLYAYRSENPTEEIKQQQPDIFKKLKSMGDGMLETSRYILHHNPSLIKSTKTKQALHH